MCLQMKGHGSYSELGEVEGLRRYLKVLLAEDNLINMKVAACLPCLPCPSALAGLIGQECGLLWPGASALLRG